MNYFFLIFLYVLIFCFLQPFIDECLKYGNQLEAKKYLPRVKDEFKVKYLAKLK